MLFRSLEFDGREIELKSATGVPIPLDRIEGWVGQSAEAAVADAEMREGVGYGFVTSGDSFVLARYKRDGGHPRLEVWVFGIRNHGWLCDSALSPVHDLRKANTAPGATSCASCGGALKDPGMGPTYRHCPKCEP